MRDIEQLTAIDDLSFSVLSNFFWHKIKPSHHSNLTKLDFSLVYLPSCLVAYLTVLFSLRLVGVVEAIGIRWGARSHIGHSAWLGLKPETFQSWTKPSIYPMNYSWPSTVAILEDRIQWWWFTKKQTHDWLRVLACPRTRITVIYQYPWLVMQARAAPMRARPEHWEMLCKTIEVTLRFYIVLIPQSYPDAKLLSSLCTHWYEYKDRRSVCSTRLTSRTVSSSYYQWCEHMDRRWVRSSEERWVLVLLLSSSKGGFAQAVSDTIDLQNQTARTSTNQVFPRCKSLLNPQHPLHTEGVRIRTSQSCFQGSHRVLIWPDSTCVNPVMHMVPLGRPRPSFSLHD